MHKTYKKKNSVKSWGNFNYHLNLNNWLLGDLYGISSNQPNPSNNRRISNYNYPVILRSSLASPNLWLHGANTQSSQLCGTQEFLEMRTPGEPEKKGETNQWLPRWKHLKVMKFWNLRRGLGGSWLSCFWCFFYTYEVHCMKHIIFIMTGYACHDNAQVEFFELKSQSTKAFRYFISLISTNMNYENHMCRGLNSLHWGWSSQF